MVRIILTAACTVAILAMGATAQIVDSLQAVKDNTLYESATGALSNGSGEYFFAGRTSQISNYLRRGLIAFDIAAEIPADHSIDSVKLILNMSRSISGTEAVSIHRVLSDWGEGSSNALASEGSGAAASSGDATWLHTFFDTGFWSTPGGDFAPSAAATIGVNLTGKYTWGSTTAMVSDVTSWRDNPAGNFGWILVGNESVTTTAKRFDSRESVLAANRPILVVYHTAPVALCCTGTTGDINDDGADADPVDLSYLVDFLFSGGPGPACPEEADVNGDDAIADPVDLSYLVDFLFSGGPSPVAC